MKIATQPTLAFPGASRQQRKITANVSPIPRANRKNSPITVAMPAPVLYRLWLDAK
jgi:hypothetical protein